MKTRSVLTQWVLMFILVSITALSGCEKDGPAERAGEQVDEAAEDLKEGGEDLGEEIEDSAENVEDELEGN